MGGGGADIGFGVSAAGDAGAAAGAESFVVEGAAPSPPMSAAKAAREGKKPIALANSKHSRPIRLMEQPSERPSVRYGPVWPSSRVYPDSLHALPLDPMSDT